MADVYITTTTPHPTGSYERFEPMVACDRFGVHRRVMDADAADLILFVDSWEVGPYLEPTRRHPLVRRHREKCFVFYERPHAVHFLPGVYTSVERRWHRPDRTRCGFYLAMYQNPRVQHVPASGDEPYLLSFTGARDTSPIRESIFALADGAGGDAPDCGGDGTCSVAGRRAILKDTTSQALHVRNRGSEAEKAAFEQQYADAIRDSKFVLCPRGVSPSSVRLFDVMKAGRAPVVYSDAWVPPEGPDWDRFIVRLGEDRVADTPGLLSELERESAERGRMARQAWEDWFSPEVAFHRIVEWCLSIREARGSRREADLRRSAWRQLISPAHLGDYTMSRLRILKRERRLLL